MEDTSNHRGLLIFEGIAFLILGILAVALPIVSTLSAELMIGSLLVIAGLVQIFRLFRMRRRRGFWGTALSAVLSLIVGFLLLFYPLAGIISLTILLAIFFVLDGIFRIVLGFQMRPLSNWGWLIFNGILSLALAAIIFAGWPGTALWTLGLLLGINMIFFGIALLTMSGKTNPNDPTNTTTPPVAPL